MSDSFHALTTLCLIGVLGSSAVLKLISPHATRAGIHALQLPAAAATRAFTLGWPVVELGLAAALLLVPSPASTAVAAISAAVFVCFAVVVLRALLLGASAACHCFGALDTRPLGPATLVRNLALLALAITALSGSARGSLLEVVSGLGGEAPVFQTGALILCIIAVLALMSSLQADVPSAASPVPPSSDQVSRHLLQDLFGTSHDVRTWTGSRRSLLLFVSSTCTACHALGSDVVEAVPSLEAAGYSVRVITDVEASRAISAFPALGARMYHDKDGALAAEARVGAFPSAIVIDGDTTASIVRGPVSGGQAITALMDELRATVTT